MSASLHWGLGSTWCRVYLSRPFVLKIKNTFHEIFCRTPPVHVWRAPSTNGVRSYPTNNTGCHFSLSFLGNWEKSDNDWHRGSAIGLIRQKGTCDREITFRQFRNIIYSTGKEVMATGHTSFKVPSPRIHGTLTKHYNTVGELLQYVQYSWKMTFGHCQPGASF